MRKTKSRKRKAAVQRETERDEVVSPTSWIKCHLLRSLLFPSNTYRVLEKLCFLLLNFAGNGVSHRVHGPL